jgi:hypothetical protein
MTMVDSDVPMRLARAQEFLFLTGRSAQSADATNLEMLEAEMTNHPARAALSGVYLTSQPKRVTVAERWYAGSTPAKATQ